MVEKTEASLGSQVKESQANLEEDRSEGFVEEMERQQEEEEKVDHIEEVESEEEAEKKEEQMETAKLEETVNPETTTMTGENEAFQTSEVGRSYIRKRKERVKISRGEKMRKINMLWVKIKHLFMGEKEHGTWRNKKKKQFAGEKTDKARRKKKQYQLRKHVYKIKKKIESASSYWQGKKSCKKVKELMTEVRSWKREKKKNGNQDGENNNGTETMAKTPGSVGKTGFTI